jgi:hypothetical protein
MVLHEGAASAGCTPRRPDFNWNRNSIPQPRHCFELVSMPVGPPPKSKADSILNHGAAVAPFGSPSSLGPLPTRDNMQTRPWDVLARESTRCGIGGRRIPAYSLVSQCPGLFCSGFYRIGAAPPPPEEHGPDFSPRPQVPESGPPFLQGIVTLLFRLAVIASARRVSASAVPVVGQRVVYPCN